MALSFLSGSGSGSGAKLFDIRLDDDYIVFRGNDQEAASAHLCGKVVLCLTEPLAIKHLKLTLTGMSRISWHLPNAVSVGSSRKAWKERNFFEKTWTFREAGHKNKTETLKPDNYEFPFDIVLEGTLPESIEGLPESWIVYRFRADIGRKYARDISTRKPLRIIRTLDSSALELAHAMSVENVWPNKIEYSISTPNKAVIFGTSLRVDFRLVSLLKGLSIGLVTTQVIESQEFTLDAGAVSSTTNNNTHKEQRIIASDMYNIEAEATTEILDEEVEGYQFTRYLELPKTLNQCVQDTETMGIKVRHKIKFNVQLHNPDGHTSELRATLPVSFYISPALAINENNDLVDQSPVAGRLAIESDLANSAPPLYGEHQLDQLYSEVDPSGYRTPGNFSTPGTPYGSHSNNASSENLGSLDAITSGSTSPGHVSAAALQNRLQNLHMRTNGTSPVNPTLVAEDHSNDHANGAGSSLPSDSADYFVQTNGSSGRSSHGPSPPRLPSSHSPTWGIGSMPGSASISRRPSHDEHFLDLLASGAQTPVAHFHEIENLARVPSYSTAVRANVRTPYSGPDLPTYGAAISSSSLAPTEPASVHLRGFENRSGTNLRDLNLRAPDRITAGQMQDEERRLRLMQARARA